ncbi:MAG: extracellular solute-binding protein [Spirochaetales bacterium]|nr:extracellular solute-binding protein [Spirochaetales bacterium]
MKRKYVVLAVLSFLVVAMSFGGPAQEAGAEQVDSKEPVTIRWWDWHDSMAEYAKATFEEFEKRNPGIKVEYTLNDMSQHNQAVTLAVRSGDVPEIMGKPTNMLFGQAVESGWFQPLNAYVEDLWPGGFETWKARYPQAAFMEGLNMVDGEVYAAPKMFPAGFGAVLYYNKTLFREAGLDPEKPPTTWSEIREAAKKITEAGKGQYYGFIEGGKQLNRWQSTAEAFAAVHGGIQLSGLDYRTGKFAYDNGAFEDAIEFFKSIDDDGSFYPGYLSINAREARALYGLGKAGFLIQGDWCIGVWRRDNPDLDFGVILPPPPDQKSSGAIYATPMAQAVEFMLSADCKYPTEGMELFLYRTSDEWYEGWVKGGFGYAPFPVLNTEENLPYAQLYDVFVGSAEQRRLAPVPELVNAQGVGAVWAEFKTPSPGIREIFQGYMTGQVTDLRGQLADLTEKLDSEMDRAIVAARGKGTDVSRQDFVFPNWEIGKDYTTADYDKR